MSLFIDPESKKVFSFDQPGAAPSNFVPETSDRPSSWHSPVIEGGQHKGWHVADLSEVRRSQVAAINSIYSDVVAGLVSDYPPAERATFDMQRSEAEAYRKWADDGGNGPAPKTPCLSRIVEGRNKFGMNETLNSLSHSVIEKSENMSAAQVATGVRQALVKKIEAAETYDDITAIEWPGIY